MSLKSKIGIIGCGNISSIYLTNCARFENIEVAAVADLDGARAAAQAEKFGISRVLGVDEIFRDDGIDIILNLTIPAAHGEIALKALEHGKSVYNEKPLAAECAEARAMIELAEVRGLRIGCAPDTFLGAGLQTCRKLLDEGAIGQPVAAVAFMLSGGIGPWHPNPFFFYQPGGGPLFDMGPYYLTALTTLLGPIRRVCGSAQIPVQTRTIIGGPHSGEVIEVRTPTHISGILDFASGAVGTIITSFEVRANHHLPNLEIYGTEGTLQAPDPNTFGEPVRLSRSGQKEWEELPLEFGYAENSRGLGLADMAAAIRSGRAHRANEATAWHVLEVMHALHESSKEDRHVELKSSMVRPEPLPPNLAFGQIPD